MAPKKGLALELGYIPSIVEEEYFRYSEPKEKSCFWTCILDWKLTHGLLWTDLLTRILTFQRMGPKFWNVGYRLL